MEAIVETNTNIDVWYITGCTSGFGKQLVEELLKNPSNRVTGTSRDIKKIQALPIEISKNPNFLGLQVDFLDEKSIQQSIDLTVNKWNRLTHVVNNAGSAIIGATEESSDKEFKSAFESLYFYPLRVIRSALPYMRKQKHGYIFNVSSVLAFKAMTRYGSYAGAKAALTATTQSLALDVKPFNIKVTSVVLGYFKTNFHNDYAETPISDYDTRNFWNTYMVPFFVKSIPGDVAKLSTILIDHYAKQSELPDNLFFGTDDSLSFVQSRFNELNDQINSQKQLNSQV